MNCKPGDLAIVVSSTEGKDDGKILRVLRLSSWPGLTCPNTHMVIYGPVWETDVSTVWGHSLRLDADLRPLGNPGEDATDEMVLRVGKPVANPEGVPA